MIAYLAGTVLRTGLGFVVLDVGGVGYQVNVSASLSAAKNPTEALTLHTALIVREDAHILFGFEEIAQLEMFELLRSVTGVGPKSALGIVSALGVEEIRNSVATGNDAAFSKVSGIGPKTAKLIAVTLSGKLTPAASSQDQELVSALVGLGYKEVDAKLALCDITSGNQQEKLRQALAKLARG